MTKDREIQEIFSCEQYKKYKEVLRKYGINDSMSYINVIKKITDIKRQLQNIYDKIKETRKKGKESHKLTSYLDNKKIKLLVELFNINESTTGESLFNWNYGFRDKKFLVVLIKSAIEDLKDFEKDTRGNLTKEELKKLNGESVKSREIKGLSPLEEDKGD